MDLEELEKFAVDFKPENYSHGDLMLILGIAICIRADIHNYLKSQR